MKETRYYILDLDLCSDGINATKIKSWMNYEEHHNKLTTEAEQFIETCEQHGGVMTQTEFIYQLNCDMIDLNNNYVYATNNY